MSITSRQPAGIPAGGQFAVRTHPEATDVALEAPVAGSEFAAYYESARGRADYAVQWLAHAQGGERPSIIVADSAINVHLADGWTLIQPFDDPDGDTELVAQDPAGNPVPLEDYIATPGSFPGITDWAERQAIYGFCEQTMIQVSAYGYQAAGEAMETLSKPIPAAEPGQDAQLGAQALEELRAFAETLQDPDQSPSAADQCDQLYQLMARLGIDIP